MILIGDSYRLKKEQSMKYLPHGTLFTGRTSLFVLLRYFLPYLNSIPATLSVASLHRGNSIRSQTISHDLALAPLITILLAITEKFNLTLTLKLTSRIAMVMPIFALLKGVSQGGAAVISEAKAR